MSDKAVSENPVIETDATAPAKPEGVGRGLASYLNVVYKGQVSFRPIEFRDTLKSLITNPPAPDHQIFASIADLCRYRNASWLRRFMLSLREFLKEDDSIGRIIVNLEEFILKLEQNPFPGSVEIHADWFWLYEELKNPPPTKEVPDAETTEATSAQIIRLDQIETVEFHPLLPSELSDFATKLITQIRNQEITGDGEEALLENLVSVVEIRDLTIELYVLRMSHLDAFNTVCTLLTESLPYLGQIITFNPDDEFVSSLVDLVCLVTNTNFNTLYVSNPFFYTPDEDIVNALEDITGDPAVLSTDHSHNLLGGGGSAVSAQALQKLNADEISWIVTRLHMQFITNLTQFWITCRNLVPYLTELYSLHVQNPKSNGRLLSFTVELYLFITSNEKAIIELWESQTDPNRQAEIQNALDSWRSVTGIKTEIQLYGKSEAPFMILLLEGALQATADALAGIPVDAPITPAKQLENGFKRISGFFTQIGPELLTLPPSVVADTLIAYVEKVIRLVTRTAADLTTDNPFLSYVVSTAFVKFILVHYNQFSHLNSGVTIGKEALLEASVKQDVVIAEMMRAFSVCFKLKQQLRPIILNTLTAEA